MAPIVNCLSVDNLPCNGIHALLSFIFRAHHSRGVDKITTLLTISVLIVRLFCLEKKSNAEYPTGNSTPVGNSRVNRYNNEDFVGCGREM